MMVFTVVVVVALPLLLALAFLLGRALQANRLQEVSISPVTRQHFEIFQTGQVNEEAVESAKRRFRAMLERGEDARVEACLRAGPQFVFHVRALAEIGTDAAGRILERQLQRRLVHDQLEQAWYWIDLAGGLRAVGREHSLPPLLQCSPSALESPLGHFYAAETTCFLGFAGYVRDPESRLGRLALRVLFRALEGMRFGVQPHVVAEARIGEMIEGLWECRPTAYSPLIVRVMVETMRFLRRAPNHQAQVSSEHAEREGFDWQVSRLFALEPAIREYLNEASAGLLEHLPNAQGQDLSDLLQALDDLHADTGQALLPLLHRSAEHRELAIRVLRWSRDEEAGRWLCAIVTQQVAPVRRAGHNLRAAPPRRPSVPVEIPYGAILYALRGHPTVAAEQMLVAATGDWDPTFRAAAFGSLGWWEPLLVSATRAVLRLGRRDPNPVVRQAARAAAARLGERVALHWFRQAIAAENAPGIFDAVQAIANEGLTLLWPDLDQLAESDNVELAMHAREATERLAEEMDRSI